MPDIQMALFRKLENHIPSTAFLNPYCHTTFSMLSGADRSFMLGITEHEAIGRINSHWNFYAEPFQDQEGEDSLRYDSPRTWAFNIYYGNDQQWWKKSKEELTPKPFTMGLQQLIPQHKFDFERTAHIKTLELDKARPLIPELMKWLQDSNWPISSEVQNILLAFNKELLPHIREIFKSNDGDWKYFLLTGLVSKLPKDTILELKPDISSIALNPSTSDKASEVDEVAKEMLDIIKTLEDGEFGHD